MQPLDTYAERITYIYMSRSPPVFGQSAPLRIGVSRVKWLYIYLVAARSRGQANAKRDKRKNLLKYIWILCGMPYKPSMKVFLMVRPDLFVR